jgi:tetratricopeptide (TPR) repeat protein
VTVVLGLGLLAVLGAVFVVRQGKAHPPEPVQAEPADQLRSELPRPIQVVARPEAEPATPPMPAARPEDRPPPGPEPVAAAEACRVDPADAQKELEELLGASRLEPALERVGAWLRCGAPAAPAALGRLTAFLVAEIRAGRWVLVESAEGVLERLPAANPRVPPALAAVHGELAYAEFEAAEYDRAERQARIARELDETDANVIAVLGELELHRGDAATALETCERGLRIHPGNARLQRCSGRAQRDRQKRAAPDEISSAHFTVSFEGRVDAEGARPTLETLEEAYRVVGALLGFQSPDRLPVVLYPGWTFSEDASHPAWAGGVYDGKVRVPSAGSTGQTLRFRGLVFHEYAHAVFQRVTRGARTPTWLNEGIAELAKLRVDPAPPVPCSAGHGLPLVRLGASFGALGVGEARRAYPEARHAVERLVARRGEDGLRALLAATGQSGDFERAFSEVYGERFDAFAQGFDTERR